MAAIALGLLTAAPTIVQGVAGLVHSIENLFGHGNGAAKKAAVINAFESGAAAYNAAAQAVPQLQLPTLTGDAEKAFSNLIDSIVAFYNATGLFSHTKPITQ